MSKGHHTRYLRCAVMSVLQCLCITSGCAASKCGLGLKIHIAGRDDIYRESNPLSPVRALTCLSRCLVDDKHVIKQTKLKDFFTFMREAVIFQLKSSVLDT